MSEVTGSIPVGDLVLSLSHVRVMLIIALFTFLDKIGTAVNFNHIQTTNGHGTGRDGPCFIGYATYGKTRLSD